MMMHADLRTGIWATAQLRTLNGQGLFAFVVHKGDEDRGGVILKRVPLDGRAVLYERARTMEGLPMWRMMTPPEGVLEAEADTRIRSRLATDRDLWVIEVEDPSADLELDAPLEV